MAAGIFDYLFDSEWKQRGDIEALRENIGESQYREAKQVEQTRRVESEIQLLALYCRTMLTLMLEKGLVTREEFIARMNQIDATDGRKDGRYTGRYDVPGK